LHGRKADGHGGKAAHGVDFAFVLAVVLERCFMRKGWAHETTWSDSFRTLDKEAFTAPAQPAGTAQKIRSKQKQTSNLESKPSSLCFGWRTRPLFWMENPTFVFCGAMCRKANNQGN
jgi:hypothetical protein